MESYSMSIKKDYGNAEEGRALLRAVRAIVKKYVDGVLCRLSFPVIETPSTGWA
jgi:hypothetical protein